MWSIFSLLCTLDGNRQWFLCSVIICIDIIKIISTSIFHYTVPTWSLLEYILVSYLIKNKKQRKETDTNSIGNPLFFSDQNFLLFPKYFLNWGTVGLIRWMSKKIEIQVWITPLIFWETFHYFPTNKGFLFTFVTYR